VAYDSIRLTAYEPGRAAASFVQQWYGLVFPARWRKLLLEYWKLGKRNPDRREHVPIRHLNDVIRAVAPDLVTVARGASVHDSQPWIYARQPFPIPLLRQMVLAWIRGLHPETEFLAATTEFVEALDFDELCWDPVTVDLLGHQLNAGGTAEPDGRLYQLLPDELARRALELEPYSFEDVHLSFRIAPSTRGAELISWPPREHLDDDGTWKFSLVISLTVQTVPFGEDFRVHVRTGVRRWCTNGPASIPYRRAVSAYLLTSSPWLQGGPNTARFAVSSLCRGDTPGTYEWTRGGPEGMLRQLSFAQHFPEPQDLQAAPGGWIDGLSGVTAGVVYSTHMGEHGVGAGLMPRDRAPLSDWVARAFEPYLRRVPDHRPSAYPVVPRNLAKKPTGKTAEEKEQSKAQILRLQQRARREGLARILEGEPLETEVIWQDSRTRDGLLAQLAEALGLVNADSTDTEPRVWRTDELTIHVSLEQAGAMAAPLSFPGPQPRRKDLHHAISQRRRQAADHFSSSNRPAAHLTLIEIGHPQDFGPLTDPKFALRLGCADSGRLTQFINTPSSKRKTATQSSIAHRAQQSWLDGFRQLGLSIVPEPSLDGLPANLHHIALWLVKRRADGPTGRRRMTPVAVRTGPSGAISGWDMDAGEWVPYRHMLLRLARHAEIPGEEEADTAEESGNARAWAPDLEEQRAITAQFIKTLLYSLRGEQVLLMTHAQNSRNRWPALLNGNLRRDTLQFGASAAQGIGLYSEGLRHVRIRDHAMDETPQWYAPAQKNADQAAATDHFGIAGGLWLNPHAGDDCGTFISTASKASTAKNAAVDASKISPRENLKGNTVIDTGQNASNPGIIELTVAGCNPAPEIIATSAGDPELWAALVHQFRRAPDYRDTLALPLQMHLAKLAEEYVLPHDSSDAGHQISSTEDDRLDLGELDSSEDQHLAQDES
jgi:hypothetical protein